MGTGSNFGQLQLQEKMRSGGAKIRACTRFFRRIEFHHGLLGISLPVDTGYCVITPATVIRPMLSLPGSVNHSAPSDPVVMLKGMGVGYPVSGYIVAAPAVVIRPIPLYSPVAVTHSAPSGPAVMPLRERSWLGSRYSVITPAVVIRPM